MPTLCEYAKPDVPTGVAAQIRAFVRMQWPSLDARDGRLWDVPRDSTARTFALLDGDVLVSHAEANLRAVEHAGGTFIVGGISTVFTFPAHRGSGCAGQVVRAATAHLDGCGADLAMLFCGETLRRFYVSCGWEAVEAARILRGARATPTPHEGNLVMMRFISEKGRAARTPFATQPVYVGERTW